VKAAPMADGPVRLIRTSLELQGNNVRPGFESHLRASGAKLEYGATRWEADGGYKNMTNYALQIW
jgi:hypothetical protein